jgi:hypothetical protein
MPKRQQKMITKTTGQFSDGSANPEPTHNNINETKEGGLNSKQGG